MTVKDKYEAARYRLTGTTVDVDPFYPNKITTTPEIGEMILDIFQYIDSLEEQLSTYRALAGQYLSPKPGHPLYPEREAKGGWGLDE